MWVRVRVGVWVRVKVRTKGPRLHGERVLDAELLVANHARGALLRAVGVRFRVRGRGRGRVGVGVRVRVGVGVGVRIRVRPLSRCSPSSAVS